MISRGEFDLWDHHADSHKVEEWKRTKFQTQKQELEIFGQMFITIYPNLWYSWYLHIVICHTSTLWERVGSLLLWTNQGNESSNFQHRMITERIGVNGGFDHSDVEDLVLYVARLTLYESPSMMNEFEVFLRASWEDIKAKRNQGNKMTQAKQRRQIGPQQNPNQNPSEDETPMDWSIDDFLLDD